MNVTNDTEGTSIIGSSSSFMYERSPDVYNILIVDDERSNIIALANILRPPNTIFVAKDGLTAVEVAIKQKPDLILLDILMPDMTGFEVLQRLKDSKMTWGIPVIFITGLDSVEDEAKGFLLGAVDYIKKPFNSVIVKARVGQQLRTIKQMHTIERMVMIDALTEIPNRRGFDFRLAEEWKRCGREKCSLSILMIDVDLFKVYNDTYGHPQGDVLLQTIADVFRRTLKRASDYVARWGGEEFAVLLPNTDLNGALAIAEQIRGNIELERILCTDGSSTKTTVSIGVSSIVPVPSHSVSFFVSMADKALYEAKNSGRNRVCAASNT